MTEYEQAGGWIDAAAAAARLGVKPATLYAYVSRGVLHRRRDADGRRSLFNAAEIEELARRGKPRRPPNPSELVIESQITALGRDRPYYRGRDAIELAESYDFETVAAWLWTAEPPDHSQALAASGTGREGWRVGTEALRAAVAAQSGLPAEALPLDRLQVITTALAVADPLRFHLGPESVVDTARTLITGLVEALPTASAEQGSGGAVAARLWEKLCPHPAQPGLLKALGAALVLLADHELAASTLAARVAASVRADPYGVVAAGLGVLSGPLHGGASYGVERLIAEVDDPARATRVIGDLLRRGERVPGLGHPVYKSGDQRGTSLFALVKAAAPGHGRLLAAEAILAEARRRRLPEPNIDFALGTLRAVADMITGAGEAIFAVARAAGWLAHALEEYERGTPLRPRALYTGPPPAG